MWPVWSDNCIAQNRLELVDTMEMKPYKELHSHHKDDPEVGLRTPYHWHQQKENQSWQNSSVLRDQQRASALELNQYHETEEDQKWLVQRCDSDSDLYADLSVAFRNNTAHNGCIWQDFVLRQCQNKENHKIDLTESGLFTFNCWSFYSMKQL